MSSPVPLPPKSRLVTFRNSFISGALLLAPLIVTILAFSWVVDAVGGKFRPLYEHYLPESLKSIPFLWDLLATGVVLLLVTALGYLSNYVFGKMFLRIAESAIQRIPGVSSVYNSVKSVVSTFGSQNRNIFIKAVVVEFPRPGIWSIGFLTNQTQGEPQAATGREIWTLFVPTTPNPTTGFLLLVPRDEVRELGMSVGDAMKMIISGGNVIPPWPAPAAVALPAESRP